MTYVTNLLVTALAVAAFLMAFMKTDASLSKRGLMAVGILGAYQALVPDLISALLARGVGLHQVTGAGVRGLYVALFAFAILAIVEFLENKFLSKERDS